LRFSLHYIWGWILLNFIILSNDHVSFRIAWRSRTFLILIFAFSFFLVLSFLWLVKFAIEIQTCLLYILGINFWHYKLLKLFLRIRLFVFI
jgi:hypothetical protein